MKTTIAFWRAWSSAVRRRHRVIVSSCNRDLSSQPLRLCQARSPPRIGYDRQDMKRTLFDLNDLPRRAWKIRSRSKPDAEAPPPPRMLTYTTTFTCNARCIMCDSWKKSPQDELSLQEIERIARQLPRLDVVRLTGGEPFVRRDLPQIAQIFVEHVQPRMLHITSNGLLDRRIIEFCETRGRADSSLRKVPLHLLISVDGVGGEHDRIRGRDIAWQRVVSTLSALAPRQKELNLRLAVNQTIIDRKGLGEYRKLREMLQDWGIPHQMVIAYESSATYDATSADEVTPAQHAPDGEAEFRTYGDLDPQELADFAEEVEADLQHLPMAERLAKRYYLRGIVQRLVHQRAEPNPPCVALGAHLRIFPNGDVPTCQFNGAVVGNLRERSFGEVWASQAAHQGRDWVQRCPGCWAECEVLPSAVYSFDLMLSALRS